MATGYNVGHVQVAPKTASPTFLDVKGAVNIEPNASTNNEPVYADGGVYVTNWDPAEGSGDLTYVDEQFGVRACLNGGVVSSSGTGTSEIERYEQLGNYIPAPVILADWIPNTDRTHDPDVAGIRTTIPNATAGLIQRRSGQRTSLELTAPIRFQAEDETKPLFIIEKLASAPTFTSGVMPVNLTAPTP